MMTTNTMSSIALTGTYADVPTNIIIDCSVPNSILSTLFSCIHNVPQDIKSERGVAYVSSSGPVLVPTSDGWFRSRMPFVVTHLTRGDVLLGANWLAACQPQCLHRGILQPSQGALARLPSGHTWIPAHIPNMSSHGESLRVMVARIIY